MFLRTFSAVALAAVMLALNAPASAQVQRSGGGESQKLMQQYQQLAGEKTALQSQIEQLKKNLDAATAEIASLKKERTALKTRSGAPTAATQQALSAKEAAERNLEQSKQRMGELVTRFRETATNLKEVEADRSKLQKEIADSRTAFDTCAESNLQLFEITNDVLTRYEKVGLFTRASASEPFTRLTRTRIENLVDSYRRRAEELRAKKPKPKS